MSDLLAFDSPAAQWDEALPLGNGRLGAMIFGIPGRETIQLNEDSIWSGADRDRNNPAALASLPQIRRLLEEGRAGEAEELCLECFSGLPPAQCVYQTAGELQINFSPDGKFGLPWSGTRGGALLKEVSGYRRELDFSTAVHSLSFEHDGTVFRRECFITAEAGCFVMRFTANKKDGNPAAGKISFRAVLDRGVFYNGKGNIEDAAFISRDTDIPFCAAIKVVQKGGTRQNRGGFITVYNADEAILLLDIRTGFREKNNTSACCEAACIENLNRAAAIGWEKLLADHVNNHKSLYDRMKLQLHGNEKTEQYFNYCRYLLISCSRPGSLPANLQGLWNRHLDPPWGCDYTININTQMNYWPALMCNLFETQQPLFDLTERLYPNGKRTAQVMYGCRGFTAHHNTNIWADTAPRDYWLPGSYWTLGAAWLTLHIWEHYEYTLDKNFLQKYFYLLREACIFFVDYLIPGKNKNEKGEPYLVVSPASSPENSYLLDGETVTLSIGCEMDNQILRKLFDSAIKAAAVLGIENKETSFMAELQAQFTSVLERLPAPSIHSNGTIREWIEEYEEAEPGHRHFSHLWTLWPGDYITPDETPLLAQAALKTIERRLSAHGGHTGWSRAWLVNFMARLGKGEEAMEHLNSIFNDFTLPNLFNTHPPFQIDGNFGSLAGMTQMLVQSRLRSKDGKLKVILDILPALPKDWPSGSVKGARAKGNLEVGFDWNEGKLTSLIVKNMGDEEIHALVRTESKQQELILLPGKNDLFE
jgi:alpha-L-fucosidase 2